MSLEISAAKIPSVTTDQMREVDRVMVDGYNILLMQMMENAGRNLAHLARTRFLGGDPRGCRVLVLAGTGGNGGGGLVCARRLRNWGADVKVWITAQASQFAEIPRHQFTILEKMEVPGLVANDGIDLPAADLIVDAIVGYGLRGAPAGSAASLITAANAHGAPILSLDVPSGVDTTTGVVYDPAVRATATLTLALPKQGLRKDGPKTCVGELYLGDISVPPELTTQLGFSLEAVHLFAKDEVIRIW